jgi:hypothetical protein
MFGRRSTGWIHRTHLEKPTKSSVECATRARGRENRSSPAGALLSGIWRGFKSLFSTKTEARSRPKLRRVEAMSMTQPIERIEYTEREVGRYKDDVESWKSDHDALATNCWVWEDLIAKASFLFDRIMSIDVQYQQYILMKRGEDELGLGEKLRELLRAWLDVSLQVVARGECLQRDYGHVDGLDALKENVRDAKSILTPDDEFFDPVKLSSIRDEAIKAHRSGLTEPLLGNERAH